MVPAIALLACPALAVPAGVMEHVVRVESSFNPYAIGVVGGRLARQPRNLPEAVATARMLEARGFNFSLGLAQVNRYNLARYGLPSYEKAFDACPNLQAGARILAECQARSGGDWGKAFSCYYSGNFVTGYRTGYVQKVFASMQAAAPVAAFAGAIPLAVTPARRAAVSPAATPRVAAWRRRTLGEAPTRAIADLATPTASAARRPAVPEPADAFDAAPAAATDDDAIAVLDAAGRPPALVSRPNATPSAAPARPPADTAFVF